MRDLGVSEDKAIELMLAWNERCEWQWDPDELSGKIANAYEYAQNPDEGADALPPLAEMFGGIKIELPSQNHAAIDEPHPVSSLLARVVVPVEDLIPGLVEKGIPTFLAGPGGVHKSRLALQWGLAINSGTMVFGRTPLPATLFYVSAEDGEDELARRAQAISRKLGLPTVAHGVVWDRKGKDSALVIMRENGDFEICPFAAQLAARLRAISGHKFVVLDSAYDFVRFAGRAKIDEDAVNFFIKVILQRLCDDTNSTVLIPWHPSQAGQGRDEMDGWSVAWHNAPRSRLSLQAVKDTTDTFELKVVKRNHGPKGAPIILHWSDGALLPRTSLDTVEQEAAFHSVCIRLAIKAAKAGAPIQKQEHCAKWIVNEIEARLGRRPSDREIKDELAGALPRQELRYVSGHKHRTAGYYPWDEVEADELARHAKRLALQLEEADSNG